MEYLISKDIKQNNKTIVTIGNFDGVHLGHLNLINCLKEQKKLSNNKFKTVAFSFNPHPMTLFNNGDFKLIFDLNERKNIFSDLGIDLLIEYPFDLETRTMQPIEFIKRVIIDELNCQVLIIGKDYSFGKNKEGNVQLLKDVLLEKGIEVIVVDEVLYNDKKIASSTIRNIILDGDMEEVTYLLGKPYFIIAEVIHGKKLGRTIGFPTMNVVAPSNKLMPPRGVYISSTLIDGVKYNSITNIGVNPTVNGNNLVIESHVLDYTGNAYGKVCKFEILKKIRDEKKFNSVDELKKQIDIDVKTLNKYLKK